MTPTKICPITSGIPHRPKSWETTNVITNNKANVPINDIASSFQMKYN